MKITQCTFNFFMSNKMHQSIHRITIIYLTNKTSHETFSVSSFALSLWTPILPIYQSGVLTDFGHTVRLMSLVLHKNNTSLTFLLPQFGNPSIGHSVIAYLPLTLTVSIISILWSSFSNRTNKKVLFVGLMSICRVLLTRWQFVEMFVKYVSEKSD